MKIPKVLKSISLAFSFFVFFSFSGFQTVFAVSSVIALSGLLSHDNNTFTIRGTEFGTESSSVGPVAWDNMESGSFSSKWSGVGNSQEPDFLKINNDNNRHDNSKYNGFSNFDGDSSEKCSFKGGTNSPQWFVQYWFKLGTDWEWGTSGYNGGDANLANIKIFRMWSTGSTNENYVVACHGYAGKSMIEVLENIDSSNQAGYFKDNVDQLFTLDTWHLLQFEFRDSDIKVNNGRIRIWLDGALIRSADDLKTREDSADYKRPYIVGFYDSWNDDGRDNNYMWIDDVYIDNTFARVEIGDKPVYNDCTHREIQIPTAWSKSSITITVNQGSFVKGDTVYLFVVDSDGNVINFVDSDGNVSPVTIGALYTDGGWE